MKKALILFSLLAMLGCTLSVKTVNRKKDAEEAEKTTALSTYANNYFWEQLHGGHYENLDSVLFYLSAAYNENPNHLETVAHLGFSHIWALSERRKLDTIPPTITDHGTLALKYFGEAYKLNPKDPRILGFLADLKMAVGSISDDKSLVTDGYFNGKKSIHQWKEFNYFTVGYSLSQLSHESWQFDKALEWQWKTLDECYCEKFDREHPDITKYLPMEAEEDDLKRKRACWNSWIAPHNVEGFYMNMGDMLVKDGDWQKAVEVYGLAKQIPEYESWDFKELLQKRIDSAQVNVQKFREPVLAGQNYADEDIMMIHSSVSCMACHQMSDADKANYADFDWERYKKEYKVYGH